MELIRFMQSSMRSLRALVAARAEVAIRAVSTAKAFKVDLFCHSTAMCPPSVLGHRSCSSRAKSLRPVSWDESARTRRSWLPGLIVLVAVRWALPLMRVAREVHRSGHG